jgi:hypothetical protein
MRKRWGAVIVCAALCATLWATPAEAAFPGQNGKIAYVEANDIWTVNPDGTGATNLTNDAAREVHPAWSPDGKQIAFSSTRSDPNPGTCGFCMWTIDVMDADGTDAHVVYAHPTNHPAYATSLAWSPDGNRIAFTRLAEGSTSSGLWTIAANGTDLQKVPSTYGECGIDIISIGGWSSDGSRLNGDGGAGCSNLSSGCVVTIASGDTWCDPHGGEWVFQDWSPDASRFVVGSSGALGIGLHSRHRDGGDLNELTPAGEAIDGLLGGAAWSPDGTTIVFRRDPNPGSGSSPGAYLIDAADGGNLRPLGGPHVGCCYDWQPIPINAYPRPVGAYPTRVSLVPAYQPCSSPNRTHGPPLGFGSCNPPSQEPGQLTVGTPDSNGKGAKSLGHLRVTTLTGNPATPADEADVRVLGNITDVRMRSGLSDYTGDLEARFTIQITDKNNTPHPGGPGAATVEPFTQSLSIPCTGTADTTVGSTCQLDTTVEALLPGAVVEKRRAIWELGAIRVHDGAGNLFLTQGLFVP